MTVKIDKIRLFKLTVTFFGVALATFCNISKMCKIEKFQRNLSTIFLKILDIYLFSKIFQKVEIVMLRWNILQYLNKILREYFSSNERLEIFLTYFCNILCYVGNISITVPDRKAIIVARPIIDTSYMVNTWYGTFFFTFS